MKRLFCWMFSLAVLSMFTGACSSEPGPPPAGSEPLSTDGDVSQIAFSEIRMNGCDGKNAVLGVTITNKGTGTASFVVTYPSNSTSGSPNAILAQERVDIVPDENHVDLSINADVYKGGEIKLDVQAGNYVVKPGEKGLQSASNAMTINDVSNEKCRLIEERNTVLWLVSASIAVAVIIGAVIFTLLRRRRQHPKTF